MSEEELNAMLYQMERVIITARKYPDLFEPGQGRSTVAGKLAGELHALEQLPQYKKMSQAADLWRQIWGDGKESFQDAVRNDPDMTTEQKAKWLTP